jgi:hypothetical protein
MKQEAYFTLLNKRQKDSWFKEVTDNEKTIMKCWRQVKASELHHNHIIVLKLSPGEEGHSVHVDVIAVMEQVYGAAGPTVPT